MTRGISLSRRGATTAGPGRLLAAALLGLGLAAAAGAVLLGREAGRDRPDPIIIPIPPPQARPAAGGAAAAAARPVSEDRGLRIERRLDALAASVDALRATVAAIAERTGVAPPGPGADGPRYVGTIADGAAAEVADASGGGPTPLTPLSAADPDGLPPAPTAGPAGAPARAALSAAEVRAGAGAGSAAYRAGDYAAAERAWRPLAAAGDARAQFQLAALYDEGRLGARDLLAAHAWAGRAAAQGHPQAAELLARVEAEMTPDRLATARRLPAECAPG